MKVEITRTKFETANEASAYVASLFGGYYNPIEYEVCTDCEYRLSLKFRTKAGKSFTCYVRTGGPEQNL